MTMAQVIDLINKHGRFESLVQMPEKKDPDWPKWVARATTPELKTVNGQGSTAIEALERLAFALSGGVTRP